MTIRGPEVQTYCRANVLFCFCLFCRNGEISFLVELQAPLLLFTGPNTHGHMGLGALSAFNTGGRANLTWFSSPLPGGPRGLSEGVIHVESCLGQLGSPVFSGEASSLAGRLT